MIERIFLIRHGLTEANEAHRYCGYTDESLSKNGVDDLFSKRGFYKEIVSDKALYFTSGMKRANETLGILFGSCGELPECTVFKGFEEINFGDFEGKSYDELKANKEYIKWISDDYEKNVPPRGESGEQMSNRVLLEWQSFLEYLENLDTESKDAVLISHGGTIYFIMRYLFPEKQKSLYEWQPENGNGYVLDFKGTKLSHVVPEYEKV